MNQLNYKYVLHIFSGGFDVKVNGIIMVKVKKIYKALSIKKEAKKAEQKYKGFLSSTNHSPPHTNLLGPKFFKMREFHVLCENLVNEVSHLYFLLVYIAMTSVRKGCYLFKEDILKNASTQNCFWKSWQLKLSSPRASLKLSLDFTVDRNISHHPTECI